MPFALESCNWLHSPASMCTQLPPGNWPSHHDNSLRPMQTSCTWVLCYSLLIIKSLSFVLHISVLWVLLAWVCIPGCSQWGGCQSARLIKVDATLWASVGVDCWIFPAMPMCPPSPCPCPFHTSREEVFSEVVCWEHLHNVHVSVRGRRILTQGIRSFSSGEYCLCGFANFTPV